MGLWRTRKRSLVDCFRALKPLNTNARRKLRFPISPKRDIPFVLLRLIIDDCLECLQCGLWIVLFQAYDACPGRLGYW